MIPVGTKFGKRTVIEAVGKSNSREHLYRCVCDCGNESICRGSALRKNIGIQCKSCSAKQTKNRTTHGLSKHRLYQTWKDMQARCKNKSNPSYKDYGARGITVCHEWNSPFAFIEWSENNGWEYGLTIDRIDVNQGYCPENCRWATSIEQRENVRLLTAANKSGYRGVSKKSGRKEWLSRIMIDGKIVHLGHYATAIDAAVARDEYILMHGFRYPLNFPKMEVEARKAQ